MSLGTLTLSAHYFISLLGLALGLAPTPSDGSAGLTFAPKLLTMGFGTEQISLLLFVFNKNHLAVLMHCSLRTEWQRYPSSLWLELVEGEEGGKLDSGVCSDRLGC